MPTPPATTITIFGANPPESSACVHDLSISSYNYQVQQVGYQVFTDKLLKGKTKIEVSVSNYKLVDGSRDENGILQTGVCTGGPKTCTMKTVSINSYGSEVYHLQAFQALLIIT